MTHAFFPLLFALSYVLTLYHHNIGDVRLTSLYKPVAVITVIWLLLWLVLSCVFAQTTKRMIYFSLITVLMFSFRDNNAFIPQKVLYVLYVFILAVSYSLLFKAKTVRKVSQFVAGMAFVSIGIPLVHILYYETAVRSHIPVESRIIIRDDIPDTPPLGYYPDIYYIVPDSFSSTGVMKKYMGWDNSVFDDFLKGKGFYVASNATSNYPKTYLSLSSTLNMEYLDYLSVHTNSTDETLVSPLIKNNAVLLFLLDHGYAFYQIGSWWGPTQYNPRAEKNFNLDLQNSLGISMFDTIIIDSTAVRPLLPKSWFSQIVTESEEDKRKRTIYQFNTLAAIPPLPGPKFVFAHILAPHAPNVFGPDCQFVTPGSLAGTSYEIGYTDQVRCISRKLEETVSAILSKSKKPPVILIHSDEGAPYFADALHPPDNWKDAPKDLLRKKFPVMAAYYLPDVSDEYTLYPSITPVNAFRVILNKYFQTSLPILEDRNFINLDMEHRYEYREVTDIVQAARQ